MSFAKKMMLLSLLWTTAVCAAAAQDHVVKFTLAHEANIAATTLPAGDYRMMIYTTDRLLAIVSPANGGGPSVMALPMSNASYGNCGKTSLRFTPSGHRLDLSSVCLGESAMSLYFPVLHSKQSEVATQNADTAALAGAQ